MHLLIACLAMVAAWWGPSADTAPHPKSALVFTVHGGTDVSGPVQGRVTLTCAPPGGTHADPTRACAALAQVHGEFTALRPLNAICPLVYQPVTVEVRGHWRGRVVAFRATYGNRCAAFDESHGVFRF